VAFEERSFRLFSSLPKAIEAPWAGTVRGEEQEDEAEQNGGLTVVLDWPEAPRLVKLKVGHGHLAREDEGHKAREEAGQNERAADQLEYAADPNLRHHPWMSSVLGRDTTEPVEDFHATSLHEDEPRHHAQQEHADYYRPISIHGVPHFFQKLFDVELGDFDPPIRLIFDSYRIP
jgi:hypothetical protein